MYETVQQLKGRKTSPPDPEVVPASSFGAKIVCRVILGLSLLLTAVGLIDVLAPNQPFAQSIAVAGLILVPTCLALHVAWSRQVEIVPEPRHGLAAVFFPFMLGSLFYAFHAEIQYPLLDRWLGIVCLLPGLLAYALTHVSELPQSVMRWIVLTVFPFTWLLAALIHINCALGEPVDSTLIQLVTSKEVKDGSFSTKDYWLVLEEESTGGETRRLKVSKEVYGTAIVGEPIREIRAVGILDVAWTKSIEAVSIEEWRQWKARRSSTP